MAGNDWLKKLALEHAGTALLVFSIGGWLVFFHDSTWGEVAVSYVCILGVLFGINWIWLSQKDD